MRDIYRIPEEALSDSEDEGEGGRRNEASFRDVHHKPIPDVIKPYAKEQSHSSLDGQVSSTMFEKDFEEMEMN